ncbi:hypothetical protein AGMMS49982_08940 [Bacteroidia bacterium]|nr:hypothetical protein AGMMS49982_08940 [Bacteroidia bacterium]
MKQSVNINEIERLYPDEWILLGNPKIDKINQKFLAGEVVYHSRDKKEVCYLGKPLIGKYDKTALFFNRVTPLSNRSLIASLFHPVTL